MNKISKYIIVNLSVIIVISIIVLYLFGGLSYYITKVNERFWHINHHSLNPSGIIGLWLGVLGSLMLFVGTVFYSLRKRFKRFRKYGSMKFWFNLHLVCCTLGPVLILYHTTFKFGGLVSISFWSMVFVFFSGLFGKFLYSQIPRSIRGEMLSLKEIKKINLDLTDKLLNDFNIDRKVINDIEKLSSTSVYEEKSILLSIQILIKNALFNKNKLRRLKNEIKNLNIKYDSSEFMKIARSKVIFARKIGLLRISHRILKNWRKAHIYFTLVMFIILALHIVITVLFGYNLKLF